MATDRLGADVSLDQQVDALRPEVKQGSITQAQVEIKQSNLGAIRRQINLDGVLNIKVQAPSSRSSVPAEPTALSYARRMNLGDNVKFSMLSAEDFKVEKKQKYQIRIPRVQGSRVNGPFSSESVRYNKHRGQYNFDPGSNKRELDQIVNVNKINYRIDRRETGARSVPRGQHASTLLDSQIKNVLASSLGEDDIPEQSHMHPIQRSYVGAFEQEAARSPRRSGISRVLRSSIEKRD